MNRTGPLEMGIGFYSMQSAYMRPRRHSYLYVEAPVRITRDRSDGLKRRNSRTTTDT